MLSGQSGEAISQLLSIMARIDESLPDDKLRTILQESKLNLFRVRPGRKDGDLGADEEDEEISDQWLGQARELKRQIIQKGLISGMSNIVLADVLSASSTTANFATYKDITHESIFTGVDLVKKYYGLFAESRSIDQINAFASTELWEDPCFKFARYVYRSIAQETGASMQARLSYVINTIFDSVYGKEYCGLKTEGNEIVPGLLYKLDKDESLIEDLSYVEAFVGWTVGLRAIQSQKTSIDALQMSTQDLINNAVFKTKDAMPYIPIDMVENYKPDTDKVFRIIQKRWMMRVIERIATYDYGTVLARINSISDSRKFKRSDALDNNIQMANVICSVVFDSFLDVIVEFKEFIHDPRMYFGDVHPIRREKFSKFFFDEMAPHTSFTIPPDSPRYLYEPAVLLNHHAEKIDLTDAEFVVTDDVYKGEKMMIKNPETLDSVAYYMSAVIKGSIYDSKMAVSKDLIMDMNPYTPAYLVRAKKTSLLMTDALGTVGSVVSVRDLMTKTKLSSFLREKGSIHHFYDADDMAGQLRIPFVVAKSIFQEGLHEYIVFPRSDDFYIWWDFEQAPYVEMSIPETSRFIPPFVGRYPFVIQRVFSRGIRFEDRDMELTNGKKIPRVPSDIATKIKGKTEPEGGSSIVDPSKTTKILKKITAQVESAKEAEEEEEEEDENLTLQERKRRDLKKKKSKTKTNTSGASKKKSEESED